MDKHNPQIARSRQLRTSDIIHIFTADKLAADNSGKARDKCNAQRDNHVPGAAAKKGYEHKRQKNARKCEQHIVDAHQNFIQNSAEISGKRPDDNTEYRADRYCAKRHEKRRAAAL